MNTIILNRALTADALQALCSNVVQVVRVKDFYEEAACKAVADALIASPMFGRYVNASSIGRVGMAFFEAATTPENLRKYFDNAPAWLDQMRAATAPVLSPIDKLRLELDEAWLPGAKLARLQGRPMFAGLLRVFEEGAGAEPHVDNAGWDAEAVGLSEEASSPIQIAANIYLEVPDRGGELVIWPHCPDRIEFEARRIPNSYGIRVDGLPEPMVIRPERRELILFNSRQVHMVNKSESRRVTASTFIVTTGPSELLEIFS